MNSEDRKQVCADCGHRYHFPLRCGVVIEPETQEEFSGSKCDCLCAEKAAAPEPCPLQQFEKCLHHKESQPSSPVEVELPELDVTRDDIQRAHDENASFSSHLAVLKCRERQLLEALTKLSEAAKREEDRGCQSCGSLVPSFAMAGCEDNFHDAEMPKLLYFKNPDGSEYVAIRKYRELQTKIAESTKREEELRAEVLSLKSLSPWWQSEAAGSTHHERCWEDHRSCALEMIARLTRELEELRGI